MEKIFVTCAIVVAGLAFYFLNQRRLEKIKQQEQQHLAEVQDLVREMSDVELRLYYRDLRCSSQSQDRPKKQLVEKVMRERGMSFNNIRQKNLSV